MDVVEYFWHGNASTVPLGLSHEFYSSKVGTDIMVDNAFVIHIIRGIWTIGVPLMFRIRDFNRFIIIFAQASSFPFRLLNSGLSLNPDIKRVFNANFMSGGVTCILKGQLMLL